MHPDVKKALKKIEAPSVPVLFRAHYKMFNPGESAGFAPALASELVKHGVAEYIEPAIPAKKASKKGGK